jgi:hypothetical protein
MKNRTDENYPAAADLEPERKKRCKKSRKQVEVFSLPKFHLI